MTRNVNKLIPVVAALALAGLGSCSQKSKETKDKFEKKDAAVIVESVASEEVATVLSYGADLVPSAKVRLISMIPDTILSFPWKDGDEIQKNAVVAVVRKDGLKHGLDQLDAQMAALDVQIANLKSEVSRTSDLYSKGVATQQVLDQVKAQYEAAVAQKDALVSGKKQLAVTVGNAVIKAPVDGVLSGKAYEEGDIASPQLPLGNLLVMDPLKVELKLVEKDIARVREGQAVDLSLDAWPGRVFKGVVTRVIPYVEAATRTNTVEVTLPNPKVEGGVRELKPGMFGKAELVVERRKDVLTVSETALMMDNKLLAKQQAGQQLRKVFVVDDSGKAVEKIVRIGVRTGSRWEVLEGLQAGEKVIVRGQHGLVDGVKVNVLSVGDAAEKAKAE